jgi:Domain of unknown function (DUF4386)
VGDAEEGGNGVVVMPLDVSDAQRKAAKVAGVLHLLALVTVIVVTYGFVRPLVAGVAPAQTAHNILAHETRFRAGILGNLVYGIEVVVLTAALYVVLEPVDRLLALLAALGRAFQAVAWLVISINLFTSLRLLTQPEYARGLSSEELPVLARLYLSGFDQYYVALLFWSLGSTAGACAWLRSRYVPRALASFGIVASAWGAACTSCLFVFPGFQNIVDLNLFDLPLLLFEVALGVRLLSRGLAPGARATSTTSRSNGA